MKAYEEPTTVKQTNIGMQEKVKTTFHIIHLQAPRLAAHLLVKPTTPRTVKRQMYRNNPEVSFPENYFRIVLATLMLQKFNSEINSRISKFDKLINSITCTNTYRKCNRYKCFS